MSRLTKFLLMLLVLETTTAFAFEINTFSGSLFSTNTTQMDDSLGIAGYTIEDFEDVNLVSGLSVSFTSPSSDPTTTLAQLHNPLAPIGGSLGPFANNTWDGSHALMNHVDNLFPSSALIQSGTPSVSRLTTFHLESGASSFGIGLANFQNVTSHELLVNGLSVAVIPNLANFIFGVEVRNLYIRIDAEAGESISSVGIDTVGGSLDGLVFDRVAFSGAVPEPSFLFPFVMAIIVMMKKTTAD